jgi:flavin-dependent dehydrogenase
MDSRHDVVIVGGRIAGASLATHLALRGLDVAVVDRASFPSDTLSTHVVYPNTIARLERLGVLEEIMAHAPPPLYTAWHHHGAMFVAPHTPLEGRDWALCVRRITLDKILVDRARRAGVRVLERFTATALIGRGTRGDPVRGIRVRHEHDEQVLWAPVIVGADGVHSTVAQRVQAARGMIMPTPTMMLYAYWRDLPLRNCQEFFFDPPWIGTHFPCDDGLHLVILIGPVEEYSARAKESIYLDRVGGIRPLADRLSDGFKVSKVFGTSQLDGYYRAAAGPGWALAGDSGHFKHPAAVQGIGDAVEASEVLSSMIADGSYVTAYPAWRDLTTREMYAFSRFAGAVPSSDGIAEIISAAATDADLARALVDIWSRAKAPWQVIPRIPAMLEAAGHSAEEVLASLDAIPAAA